MELMGSVRRDFNCLTRSNHALVSANSLDFTLKQDKRFFEVMTMRRWPTSWRNVQSDAAHLVNLLVCQVFPPRADRVS